MDKPERAPSLEVAVRLPRATLARGEALRTAPRRSSTAQNLHSHHLPSSLAAPRALGRFIAIVVPPALRGLASCGIVAPPTIRRSTWTALLDRQPLLLDGPSDPLLTAHLAFRTLVLFPKLRIVEDFPSWAVIVLDVASDDSDLGVGWRNQANCCRNYDCSQHQFALPQIW